ncbi:MAG: heavy metal-binding domain-containing protein [Acidobacteriota bacterium]|nr:heavy metal-binding domain-containing protein [Acidobacteriota bacterium]
MSDPAPSTARLDGGDIPLAAERRLAAMRSEGGAYTSDLSASDFALCHQLGMRPLAQVMGSSVYQVGYQAAYPGLMGSRGPVFAGGLIRELDTLTDAWNEARDRALHRLAREAEVLGADAVVGVQISTAGRDYGEAAAGSGLIEYAVIGTAVARDAGDRRAGPVLTELSVADYAKLIAAGVEPRGIAAWSSVCYADYGYATAARAQTGLLSGGSESFELREFTGAIYAAREQVMTRMGAQAQALGASGMVGVRISHQMRRLAVGQSSRVGLQVTFHAIGTAIDERAAEVRQAPRPVLGLP